MGVQETFTRVKKVVGDFGSGADGVTVAKGVLAEMDLRGGEGDDSITITATYDGVHGQGTVTTSFE